MNGAEAIIQQLESIARKEYRKAIVVGIAGAGCLGKTTLARNIAVRMGGKSCQVLSLDGYLLERKERRGLTGYDPRGYELNRAAIELRTMLKMKQGFSLNQYNRTTHLRDISEWIHYRPFIVVEGCLSLAPCLRSSLDQCIFIHARCEIQYQLRLKREHLEFGYDAEQVGLRFKRYYKDYQAFIEPQMCFADTVFTVNDRYEIGPYCP